MIFQRVRSRFTAACLERDFTMALGQEFPELRDSMCLSRISLAALWDNLRRRSDYY